MKVEIDGHEVTLADHVHFVQQARAAGLTPVWYRSRYGYCGPAVKGRDLDALQARIRVRTFWEKPGRYVVLYPARRDYALEAKYPSLRTLRTRARW